MTAWTITSWLDPKKPTREDFGRAVYEARKKYRNWTQAQLAQRLSVSPQTISAIENGACEISMARFLQLRRLLGETLEPYAILFLEPSKTKKLLTERRK